jgi:translation initiation factor 1 (eIF-1/SUI1)
LEDSSGGSKLLRSLTAQEAQKTQVVIIDSGKKSGKYTIVVSGLTSQDADASTAKELARLQFTVAITK